MPEVFTVIECVYSGVPVFICACTHAYVEARSQHQYLPRLLVALFLETVSL